MVVHHDSSWSRGPFRVALQCELKFAGPLHIGSGQALSVTTDAPLLRDAGGKPWLPGSSVRGVLADWCRREAPVLGVEQKHVRRLFGEAGTDADRQGRLTVFDMVLDPDSRPEIRDHVQIDLKTGAAAEGARFDQEVALPRSGRLQLVYEGDSESDPELVLLQSAADALWDGLLSFGAKAGWGLGAALVSDPKGVKWSCTDRSESGGLSSWLQSRLPAANPQNGKTKKRIAEPEYCQPRSRASGEPAAWSWLRLDVSLAFDGPMLVAALDTSDQCESSGSAARMRREADAAWQVGPDRLPLLAGSALRGPLRADAQRIVKTLGLRDNLADVLFGTSEKRGLLVVREGQLENDQRPRPLLLNHVSIDRVTGFAAGGRLFDAAALASPRFRSTLLLRWNWDNALHQGAAVLLLFVLRDAEQRGMWVGSRTTRGYGYAKPAVVHAEWSLVSPVTGGRNDVFRRDARGISDKKIAIACLGERLGFVEDAWNQVFPPMRKEEACASNLPGTPAEAP